MLILGQTVVIMKFNFSIKNKLLWFDYNLLNSGDVKTRRKTIAISFDPHGVVHLPFHKVIINSLDVN